MLLRSVSCAWVLLDCCLCCMSHKGRGLGTCHLSSFLPFDHSHFPIRLTSGQELRLQRQRCSQGIITIHHQFLLGKCKYVLANGGIIYCHKLGWGLGQEWTLAKHYSLAPLGGWAVWAELGWKGGKGQRQEFAAENWAGALHVVTVSGWNGGATTLDPDSWRISMLRAVKIGSPEEPRHLVTLESGRDSSILLVFSCCG